MKVYIVCRKRNGECETWKNVAKLRRRSLCFVRKDVALSWTKQAGRRADCSVKLLSLDLETHEVEEVPFESDGQ